MTIYLGRNDGLGPVLEFDEMEEVLNKIMEIKEYDPEGIDAGEYYIDDKTFTF